MSYQKKGGKLRPFIDLKNVNDFIDTPYFKNESIETASEFIEYDDRCVTYDLKNGYHHISVQSDFYTYLGFKWRKCTYVWQVLQFGLSCSGYFFNKVVRVVVQYLRLWDCKFTFFVDDGLLTADVDKITDHADLVKGTLCDLGFHINYEKSNLTPCTRIEWIGYIIDMLVENNVPWLYIPKPRIRKNKK